MPGRRILMVALDGLEITLLRRAFAAGRLPDLRAFAESALELAVNSDGERIEGSVWPTFASGHERLWLRLPATVRIARVAQQWLDRIDIHKDRVFVQEGDCAVALRLNIAGRERVGVVPRQSSLLSPQSSVLSP